MEISPLAPEGFPELPELAGVKIASIPVGIKYRDRDDLMLAVFDPDTNIAGVFTQSATTSAPVLLCRKNLKSQKARALIVNSGNANTFTGQPGKQHCEEITELISKTIACSAENIFVASTGVIGELLPVEKILAVIPDLAANAGSGNWQSAAHAILTTDTFAKGATVTSKIGNVPVTINGIAKGSGMIEPNMATMLAFVFTDANISPAILQKLLEHSIQDSFNSITVDSDTSTSDTCLLIATCKADNPVAVDIGDTVLNEFKAGLDLVMRNLAQQVIRDGEGATKFIEVNVTGAESIAAAKIVAKSIANSPLVKTAIAGEDANWGRIVMAVGKSGELIDQDKLQIKFGGVLITKYGMAVDNYDETQVSNHLQQSEIVIDVDIGIGSGSSRVWTSDLTHGYITINADYRS